MRFRTKEEIRQHLLSQHTSGLSIAAYCTRESIYPNTFYNWRKRQIGQKATTESSTVSSLQFLRLPTQAPETQKIDVTLPNGARLSIPFSCDMTVLRQTVRMIAPLRAR